MNKNYQERIKKQQIEATKLFLCSASNTNVEINRILYFLAWLFQCIPCFKRYINKIRAIRDLNNKFNALRISLAKKNDNDIENEEDKDAPEPAEAIFCALDNFLPGCNDVNLFNRYMFIYCSLLDLYRHNTDEIYQKLNNNFLIGPSWDVLKKKRELLKSSTDNELNNGNNIDNENENIICTDNFIEEDNKKEQK